jgi:hypothetical protein
MKTGLSEFTVNQTVPWRDWEAEILIVTEDSVIIKNLIADTIINSEQGTSEITVETGTITERFTPALGSSIVTTMGVGRMKVLNETDFIIDFNHPLAGETIVFSVTVESIEKGE